MSEARVVPYAFTTVTLSAGTSPYDESDPSTLTDGVDVRDRRQASVVVVPTSISAGATLQIWAVLDEAAAAPWVHLSREDEQINNAGSDLYGPYNVREFKRFAAIMKSVQSPTTGSLSKQISVS